MLRRWQESVCTPTPSGSFNILYFFQSAIHTLSDTIRLRLTLTGFPYPCEPVHAVNWPDPARDLAGCAYASLVDTYLQVVREQSKQEGDEFDVSYATDILTRAFSMEQNRPLARGTGEDAPFVLRDPQEFSSEEWASGFTLPEQP